MAATSSPLASHFGAMYGNEGIFQPPKASPSTRIPASIPTNDYFSGGARKRQRSDASQIHDGGYSRHSPWATTPVFGHYTASSEYYSANGLNQASFVNERYNLAGGYDTPSLQAASLFEDQSGDHHNLFMRGQMTDNSGVESVQSVNSLLYGPLARERNGVARINTGAMGVDQSSWTSFALNLVGKVFTFGGSMFRGFYAGGGKGYDLHGTGATPPHSASHDQDECSTPIPGAWDFGEMMSESEKQASSLSTTPPSNRPPNKRRQTDRDTWVMIGTPDPDSSVLSPSRRPNLTRSNNSGRTGASRANSRRNVTQAPARASSYLPPSVATTPQINSPLPVSHERRASIASVRSPHGRSSNTNASVASVISPEAERIVRRQVRQERAADKAMNSMSRRLEDLIRQGQEALGTKYSVEGDDGMMEDEGFVDEIY